MDPLTGLVYVASWERGKMYVIDGTEVVANYRLGWGPLNMAIDPWRGYVYVAHSEPNATYQHNLSVFSLETKIVTPIATAERSWDVTVDPVSGYAYATNPNDNTVTVLQGTEVVVMLPVGQLPWGIGVNPNTGYVFAANRLDDSVTVLKDGELITTIPVPGLQPYAIGVDTNNNYIYVANRGEEFGLLQCRNASVTILR